MKTWTLAIVVGALASPVLAERGSSKVSTKTIYVFGDSLSDNGNAKVMAPDMFAFLEAPYAAPRFSNGPMWPDYLAGRLRTEINPVVSGGTNYAIGGATISPENYYTRDPAFTGFAQVDRFLATSGSADRDAIYVVWLGGNDVDPPADFTRWNHAQLVAMIGRLYDAGARQFLIPNLPDIGAMPVIVQLIGDPVYTAQLSEMTVLFNTLLKELPARFPKANLQVSDVYGLVKGIAMHPEAFGFENTTEPCYRNATDGALCSNADAYWFWDYSHPTTHAHKVLAGLFIWDMLLAGQVKLKDLR